MFLIDTGIRKGHEKDTGSSLHITHCDLFFNFIHLSSQTAIGLHII
jgi:hypothetical protein